MRNIFIIFLLSIVVLPATAQRKITFGKTTFTLYSPIQSIPPTPKSGWAAPSVGYLLKPNGYGIGTHYCYAPGKPSKTTPCSGLYTELREWLYHPQ